MKPKRMIVPKAIFSRARTIDSSVRFSSRRQFVKAMVSAFPVAVLASRGLTAADSSRPNSRVSGVQIGLNVPYSFGSDTMGGDDILQKCVQLGLSAVELRAQPVEIFLGAAPEWIYPKRNPAPEAAMLKENSEKLAAWRRGVSLERVRDFRNKYETAGVMIEIVKVDGIFKMTEAELDYMFALAKALGGRAISTEISKKEEDLRRVGQFADKHRLMVGYHGHASTTPEEWEKAFSLAKYNGANVDLGHFVAGNNSSPVPFIQKHHDRITHVHVKDRKFQNGPNTPFGEGDTPIKEVLRLIRDQKWNIQATIEFEYKIPPGSDRMTEIARSVRYCRDALS